MCHTIKLLRKWDLYHYSIVLSTAPTIKKITFKTVKLLNKHVTFSYEIIKWLLFPYLSAFIIIEY